MYFPYCKRLIKDIKQNLGGSNWCTYKHGEGALRKVQDAGKNFEACENQGQLNWRTYKQWWGRRRSECVGVEVKRSTYRDFSFKNSQNLQEFLYEQNYCLIRICGYTFHFL